MASLSHRLFIIWCSIVSLATLSDAESSKCLMVYNEGGAPAVFQSPKCPRWKLSDHASRPRTGTTATTSYRCQSAMLQGRRKYQEDRTLCALDLLIPFPGLTGLKEVAVGIVAVFDGHNGAEASEMASKLLLEYFVLHTYFLLDATYSVLLKKTGRLSNQGEHDVLNWDGKLGWHEIDLERFKFTLPMDFDDSSHLEILKQALLRAIHDLDAKFSKEASSNNLNSGSTATVILIAAGQILVANVGDSKALLCSEKFQSPAEAKATLLRIYRQKRHSGAISPTKYSGNCKSATSDGLVHLFAKGLTRDHHPDRDDEKSRVEAAGGYVLEWAGVHRVNGQLALSRAIGDVSFKSYGVTSAPEVTDWQPLTANDSYLVAASDGVFETLSMQDVCDLLWEVDNSDTVGAELPSSCSYSLAHCIVNTAFERGSMDNMAAVVVPLPSTGFSQNHLKGSFVTEGGIDCPNYGLQKFMYEQSADSVTSELMPLDHVHPIMGKFDRLLIEGRRGSFECFYLFENLDENVEYALQASKDDQNYDLPQALPEALDHSHGGSLNLYNDQNLCLRFGMTVDGAQDQCINPEGFARFLGLLESIPWNDTGSGHGSYDYVPPDLSYVLKKRFGRGAYGEVWLALHWNCRGKSKSFSFHDSRNSQSSSSTENCHTGPPEENLFILKRIMVEKGTAVYLSGLREKYFGEVFLNASTCLRGLLPAEMSNFFHESQSNFSDTLETEESTIHENGNSSSENMFQNKFGLHSSVYEEGLNHIARYVESFESRSNEIWLVFQHEGVPLSKLLYTAELESSADRESAEQVKQAQVLRPSKWWHWLKTTDAGQEEMRNLIFQLLMAVKSCHDRKITHRDIKPENMVICFEDQETGKCLNRSQREDKNYTTKMRIIDFGSAIDEFTMKHLYGSTGPSRAEQTNEYTPPEGFLNSSWYQGPTNTILKYDMWSVGVVMLEFILGSPNVFQISPITGALLDQHLEGWNDDIKELAYKLRAFMEMCILIPGSSSKHHRTGNSANQEGSPASWKCSEEFFSHQIKNRDPLKLGFPNVWALRLVRNLLQWDPDDRFSVDDALRHPYFQPPPK